MGKEQVTAFHDYIVHDAMSAISGITSKRMFGGFGLYKNGVIFGIITSEGELYFKVDDKLQERYKSHESHPFVYSGYKKKKPVKMAYWTVPEEVLEDPTTLAQWIDDSVSISK